MDPRVQYVPTPEKIKQETEALQATWSEATRRRRAGYDSKKKVTVPIMVLRFDNGRPYIEQVGE